MVVYGNCGWRRAFSGFCIEFATYSTLVTHYEAYSLHTVWYFKYSLANTVGYLLHNAMARHSKDASVAQWLLCLLFIAAQQLSELCAVGETRPIDLPTADCSTRRIYKDRVRQKDFRTLFLHH